MSARSFALFLGAALFVQGASAMADSAMTEDCMIVNMQNSAATAKYNTAWQEFNATFSRDLPTLRRHGEELYATWSKIAQQWPQAFTKAYQALLDGGYTGDKPVNYVAREADQNLNDLGKDSQFLANVFPNEKAANQRLRDWKALDVRVEPQIKADDTYNIGSHKEPFFNLCFDELKPIHEGMSFVCGTVSQLNLPDEKTFIDDYVENVRSSRKNGVSDLVKPTLAQCGDSGQTQATAAPKSDDDAGGAPKQTGNTAEQAGAAAGGAVRTWGASTDVK